MEEKKYTTGINTNICSGYIDKNIQNPVKTTGQKKSCYHAVSKRTAGIRAELAKKKTLISQKDPNSQH